MRHLRDRGEMVRACFLFAPFVTHACTLLLISHFSFLISLHVACVALQQQDEVVPCIQQLNMEQITRLLSFVENWNFNTRTSREAHDLLNVVLTTTSPKHLMSIPNISTMVDSLIAYSGVSTCVVVGVRLGVGAFGECES